MKKKQKKVTQDKKDALSRRLGTVGGQAVLEGVMMKSRTRIAIAVRRYDNKEIQVRAEDCVSLRQKHKWVNIPILRGIVTFVETLVMSFRTLTASTEMLGIEDEEPGKFEKWLTKVFGKSLMAFVSFISIVLGVAIAIGLFIFVPTLFVGWLQDLWGFNGAVRSLLEGVLKIGIFIAYIAATSLLKDIRRTYQYHGAEHKSIFCYEHGLELTVENAKVQSRFHPRCGTSFIFIVLIISILGTAVLYSLIPETTGTWLRVLAKFLILPLLVGISYEYIIYAGKHDNRATRIFSAPGLWMQRLTTREPDDDILEVGIASLKTALIEEFPDYEVPFQEGWNIHGKIKKEAENPPEKPADRSAEKPAGQTEAQSEAASETGEQTGADGGKNR